MIFSLPEEILRLPGTTQNLSRYAKKHAKSLIHDKFVLFLRLKVL
jgi:hypothetical protein